MSVKQKEKLYIEKIQHQQQQQQHAESAGEDDDTMIDQAIDKANDEMLLSQGIKIFEFIMSNIIHFFFCLCCYTFLLHF